MNEEFWSHVDRSGGPDACWPWTGPRIQRKKTKRNSDKADDYGYWYDKTTHTLYPAHRFALDDSDGQTTPKGVLVLHHCDNPPCCNPKCLFRGTHADNMRDMAAKGRANQGPDLPREKHWNAKWPEELALAIKEQRRNGWTWAKLSEEFKVPASTARFLCLR